MDGAPVGAESLWPSVIRWKPVFRHPWMDGAPVGARAGHGGGSGSSTTSLGNQWMDGAPMGAESLWPNVI